MKIGVNARFLLHPYTGIGQYTRNFFERLARKDEKNQYFFLVPKKIDFEMPGEVVVLPEKGFFKGPTKTFWEQILLPKKLEKLGVEVAFFPYPSNPWDDQFYKKKIKTIVTVHDCIPWKYEEYQRGILSKIYHARTRMAVKKADLILTVSETSKKDIERICGALGEKILVTYNDVGEVFKRNILDFPNLLTELGLEEGKYFIYCGGYDKRKNVDFLLSGFKRFNKNSETKLLLIGGKLHNSGLYESFEAAGGEAVVKSGFVEAEKLAYLYSKARAFVHLSSDEGFNIPLLEAANCGCPLILSDIAVHREVASSAARFVKLGDEDDLVLALGEKNRPDSKVLAEKYSWDAGVQKVLNTGLL